MLMRRLERENIQYSYVSISENTENANELHKKYGIKSTPILLILDKDEVSDKLSSIEEIIEYLKNVSNTEIPLGDKT